MPQEIRIWEIKNGGELRGINHSNLDFEERIEHWIEEDVSIVAEDLMVIGRQVKTDFGGYIDLLCLDAEGDLVIIELKRERTPREITSQILDYASWVKDLSNERITEIASDYLGSEDQFNEKFSRQFGEPIPEVLNEEHKMLIVAAEIDTDSERIINYLSDSYGVSINAASFQYFRDPDGREFLAKVFLIEPSEVEYKSKRKSTSKRRPRLTIGELREIAVSKEVEDLFDLAVREFTGLFDYQSTTLSTVSFIGIIEDHRRTLFSLIPRDSNLDDGLRFSVYFERLLKYLDASRDQVIDFFPQDIEETQPWKSGPSVIEGFFGNSSEIKRFVRGMREVRSLK
jgi:hypothetical protein